MIGVTHGTIGAPASARDPNDGRQVVGRIGVVPATGLRITASGATGPYLARSVRPFLPEGADVEEYDQRALGLSLDWSWSRFVLAGEVARGVFESPWIADDLGVVGWCVEGKRSLVPGGYAAARFDRLVFDEIAARDPESDGTTWIGWDRDVQRIEGALGYRPTPSILLRADTQLWDEDGGSWGRATRSRPRRLFVLASGPVVSRPRPHEGVGGSSTVADPTGVVSSAPPGLPRGDP